MPEFGDVQQNADGSWSKWTDKKWGRDYWSPAPELDGLGPSDIFRDPEDGTWLVLQENQDADGNVVDEDGNSLGHKMAAVMTVDPALARALLPFTDVEYSEDFPTGLLTGADEGGVRLDDLYAELDANRSPEEFLDASHFGGKPGDTVIFNHGKGTVEQLIAADGGPPDITNPAFTVDGSALGIEGITFVWNGQRWMDFDTAEDAAELLSIDAQIARAEQLGNYEEAEILAVRKGELEGMSILGRAAVLREAGAGAQTVQALGRDWVHDPITGDLTPVGPSLDLDPEEIVQIFGRDYKQTSSGKLQHVGESISPPAETLLSIDQQIAKAVQAGDSDEADRLAARKRALQGMSERPRTLEEVLIRALDSGDIDRAIEIREFINRPSQYQLAELAMQYAGDSEAFGALLDFVSGRTSGALGKRNPFVGNPSLTEAVTEGTPLEDPVALQEREESLPSEPTPPEEEAPIELGSTEEAVLGRLEELNPELAAEVQRTLDPDALGEEPLPIPSEAPVEAGFVRDPMGERRAAFRAAEEQLALQQRMAPPSPLPIAAQRDAFRRAEAGRAARLGQSGAYVPPVVQSAEEQELVDIILGDSQVDPSTLQMLPSQAGAVSSSLPLLTGQQPTPVGLGQVDAQGIVPGTTYYISDQESPTRGSLERFIAGGGVPEDIAALPREIEPVDLQLGETPIRRPSTREEIAARAAQGAFELQRSRRSRDPEARRISNRRTPFGQSRVVGRL